MVVGPEKVRSAVTVTELYQYEPPAMTVSDAMTSGIAAPPGGAQDGTAGEGRSEGWMRFAPVRTMLGSAVAWGPRISSPWIESLFLPSMRVLLPTRALRPAPV